jgi:hypothetical protein
MIKMIHIILVSKDGTTCDIIYPGEIGVIATYDSIVDAIEHCQKNGWEYTIKEQK